MQILARTCEDRFSTKKDEEGREGQEACVNFGGGGEQKNKIISYYSKFGGERKQLENGRPLAEELCENDDSADGVV